MKLLLTPRVLQCLRWPTAWNPTSTRAIQRRRTLYPGIDARRHIAGPSNHTSRVFVLCFDGTGDQFDGDNTNVVQFCAALRKSDGNRQMVYYQPGVGTFSVPEFVSPFRARAQKYINMAIANHLNAHVMNGYEFLMENYRANDKICIFGFSRGAYTARALAGMIHKVGLLPAGNRQQVPFAYKMYTHDDDFGWEQSEHFKRTFSVDVKVDFLGAWDTVCSVGVIPHTLPLTYANAAVRYFRHAIALDERRAVYQVNHWHSGNTHIHECIDAERTDVREVWFAGCHADVGGGSVLNETRNSLARISLRWMIQECFRTKTGIQFRPGALEALGLDLGTRYHARGNPPQQPLVTGDVEAPGDPSTTNDSIMSAEASVFTTQEEEERADALSPMHDELDNVKAWWILEYLPLRHRRQYEGLGTPRHYWSVNLGRPREPLRPRGDERILVHRSVKTRMDLGLGLEGRKYEPKAKFDCGDVEWVD